MYVSFCDMCVYLCLCASAKAFRAGLTSLCFRTSIHIHQYMNKDTHQYIYTSTYIKMCINIYINIYIHPYTSMYVYICSSIYIFIHIHQYIYKSICVSICINHMYIIIYINTCINMQKITCESIKTSINTLIDTHKRKHIYISTIHVAFV